MVNLPPGFISLILFLIEFAFLIIITKKNSDHPQFRTIFAVMLLLQLYQLSEFFICAGLNENIVGRIAITAITFLPPTGFLLTTQLIKKKFKVVNWIIFTAGAGMSLYYIVNPNSIELIDCNPLYAIYQYPLNQFYGVYYYSIILASMIILIYNLIKNKMQINKQKNPQNNDNLNNEIIEMKSMSSAAIFVLLGYLAFTLPMAITVIINFSLIRAAASIMCKYAILLAITLFIFSYKKQSSKQKKV